ncbi:MAG: putative transcriptional regulatory protein LysR-family [Ramlibacter sp.]|nr:putative transcriptional regulatory protein LysR-family [Ramlibacter sp.]
MLNASYRYFHAIAQERSIRKAADRVHVSASAMSRQISLLEEELGEILLERRARGVELTGAGVLLAEHIRRLMLQEHELRADMAELSGLRHGHVRMALGNGFASSVAHLLPRFSALYPGITCVLTVASNDEILRAVDEEEVDLGLMFSPADHPSVDVLSSFAAPLVAVLSAQHRLAGRASLPITVMQQEPLALLKPSHRVRQMLQQVELQEGCRLQPVLETNSYEILKAFVADNLGMTVLPMLSVASELASRKLATVPLEHAALSSTVASLVVRRGRKLPVAAAEFLKVLQRELGHSTAGVPTSACSAPPT